MQISGFTRTDTVVQKVIKMTVETGAITTSAATADLVLFLVYPNTNLHFMLYGTLSTVVVFTFSRLVSCIPLAKLYSNTLIAMLNARKGSLLPAASVTGTLPIIIHNSTQSVSFANSANSRGDSTAGRPFGSNITSYVNLPNSPPQAQRSLPPTPPSRAPQFVLLSTSSPRSPQPATPPPAKPSHKRTESTQRLSESFASPLTTSVATSTEASGSKGWKRHVKKPLYLVCELASCKREFNLTASFSSRIGAKICIPILT